MTRELFQPTWVRWRLHLSRLKTSQLIKETSRGAHAMPEGLQGCVWCPRSSPCIFSQPPVRFVRTVLVYDLLVSFVCHSELDEPWWATEPFAGISNTFQDLRRQCGLSTLVNNTRLQKNHFPTTFFGLKLQKTSRLKQPPVFLTVCTLKRQSRTPLNQMQLGSISTSCSVWLADQVKSCCFFDIFFVEKDGIASFSGKLTHDSLGFRIFPWFWSRKSDRMTICVWPCSVSLSSNSKQCDEMRLSTRPGTVVLWCSKGFFVVLKSI